MAGWPCRVEPDQLGRPLPDSIKAALSASFIGAALAWALCLRHHVVSHRDAVVMLQLPQQRTCTGIAHGDQTVDESKA